MLVNKIPLRNSDGEITGTLGIAEDITEYKYMQAERERLQTQLQQAQKMEALGQLTGGIAHDFNNILSSVLGFAKLALRRHASDPNSELADYLREIIAAGERARDLVAKMMIFGRSRSVPITQSLAPQAMVKEVVKMLTATIPSSIQIETLLEEGLPDIAFDPVAFQQVLVNLVINARDAVGDKGKITIDLRLRQMDEMECSACHQLFSGSYVELCVTDNGQGIAPEVLPRIFEPFFTTKDVGKGTGMGLSVVHGLVSRASGHFRVESSPGSTLFCVFLPVATNELPVPAALPIPGATPAPSERTGHVLVVDDDPSILHFLSAALKDAGWQVSIFNSSPQALAAFQNTPERFDAVITDQTMPKLTGIELTAALHKQHPDLPVILCSGYSESLTDDAAMKSGAQRYLHKPVDIDALLLALAELCGKAARERA
jgi:signal transduction histidine kinase/CheY-like chemotaxis protein